MKHAISYTCWTLVVAGALATNRAPADDKQAPSKPDPKLEAMMKKAELAGAPGAAHQALEPLVGHWKAEVKCWMDPDAPAAVTQGTAKCTWELNGRFVRQEFTGEFAGKPFRGIGFTGYDNVRQKYNSVWIDDVSTTMFTCEGDANADGKVLTFTGTYSCPMTGEKHKAARQVYRILSHDKHIFEMHDPTKDPNSKTMEITYTRQ